MTTPQTQQYPRPDFERNPLRWESLNGPWDFIFDDADDGLSERWHLNGLPEQIEVAAAKTSTGNSSESDSITQRIADGTQKLIEKNFLSKSETKIVNKKREIKVPFVFQSPASGINDRGVHEVLWYERIISDFRTTDERERGNRLVLRFGAVDYEATVWVNGRNVGGHRGGHVPFELDITDAVEAVEGAAHRVTVRVFDSAYDLTQPRGKQYWGAKPESIFYTPSGGIWQNAWAEVVPAMRIADSSHGTILRSNDIASGTLHSTIVVKGRKAGQQCRVSIEAELGGLSIAISEALPLPKESNIISIDLNLRISKREGLPEVIKELTPLDDESCWQEGLALWSPEHPLLYDIIIRLVDDSGKIIDRVKTYVGMRLLDWTKGDGLWRLNDRPYFQALCLDQGYWPETLLTPPSSETLKLDIELAKKMGLNGCRKHQKVEDPLFYYWADKLGYLVWAEMANAYSFSQEYVERFNQEWVESVKLAINHPCVVTWTPVNESWGYPSLKDNVDQRNHIRTLYYMTKTLDSTRSINDNCGWEHVCTDLTTFHDYSDGPKLEETCSKLEAILDKKAERNMFVDEIQGIDQGSKHQKGAPVMCTEFGGVNIAPAKPKQGEDGEENRDWGYTTASDPADLLKRIGRLVKAVTNGGHCCAFVYTQLTDIEQEVNGLYTFDRREKLDSAKVKTLIEDALKTFYDGVNASVASRLDQ